MGNVYFHWMIIEAPIHNPSKISRQPGLTIIGQVFRLPKAMGKKTEFTEPKSIALRHLKDYEALEEKRAKNVWPLRREFARSLKGAEPEFVLEVARELFTLSSNPGHATSLLMFHRKTFETLGEKEIEEFGEGMNSWGTVDTFARRLSGPAWLRGQISDELIHKWAHSEDRWWRRAALVSTVALNVRSHGGHGDAQRTLSICKLLVEDRDDMVVKAMSWALRELVIHDPDSVRAFLEKHENVLAARVKREVWNKLRTGLKNPKRDRDENARASISD
jgi:3-methyladenine DNA glycosylase AlkD